MERSNLIQRLRAPTSRVNPFSFGGGFKNGGLSGEAMELINPIFSFAYMGNASFERGALSDAFHAIAKYTSNGNSVSGELELIKSAYYLCSEKQENYVIDLMTKVSEEGDFGNLRFAESTYFKEALEGKEYAVDTKGWIELNNGFMFFTDKEMFEKTRELFKVK